MPQDEQAIAYKIEFDPDAGTWTSLVIGAVDDGFAEYRERGFTSEAAVLIFHESYRTGRIMVTCQQPPLGKFKAKNTNSYWELVRDIAMKKNKA